MDEAINPTPVATVRGRTSFASQVVTVIAVVVPPLGLFAAMGLLWDVAFHWYDLVLLAGFYVVCAFGTTIGFHRYFTHKGFEARTPVKASLAILGCLTMQGPLTQWVTDHRKHHALSDKDGDPHSPHVGHGDGVMGAIKGFVHAHVGWLFTLKGMERGREYGKDLYEDRLVRTIDRMYMVWVVVTFGVPFAIGYAIGGTWQAGLEGLVWGGLLRVFLYQHATFSVNSICHMFGRKDYPSRDESRNNWLVAAARLRRGLAQQPPRVPVLGAARAAPLPDRHLLVGDPRDGEARGSSTTSRCRRRSSSSERSFSPRPRSRPPTRRSAPTRGPSAAGPAAAGRPDRDPVQRAGDERVRRVDTHALAPARSRRGRCSG